jgi:hypothetical protein
MNIYDIPYRVLIDSLSLIMNIKNLNSMRLERQSFLFSKKKKAPKDKRQSFVCVHHFTAAVKLLFTNIHTHTNKSKRVIILLHTVVVSTRTNTREVIATSDWSIIMIRSGESTQIFIFDLVLSNFAYLPLIFDHEGWMVSQQEAVLCLLGARSLANHLLIYK